MRTGSLLQSDGRLRVVPLAARRPRVAPDVADGGAPHDVVIIGAGILGTALLHVLCEYTNVERIALIEKKDRLRARGARPGMRQMLHVGDIEADYDLAQSLEAKRAANMVKRYLDRHDPAERMHSRHPKMVIAIGRREVRELRARFERYRGFYPGLCLLERGDIAQVEPLVMKGRNPRQEILALYSEDGCAVDVDGLAQSFLQSAMAKRRVDVHVGAAVSFLEHDGAGYRVLCSDGETELRTRTLAVTAGEQSLELARQLGCGGGLSLARFASGFYVAPALLRGKVYTLQRETMPFAALHGAASSPDRAVTRFGPTAKVIPLLAEREQRSVRQALLPSEFSAVAALARIVARPSVLRRGVSNLLCGVPVVGPILFAARARRIVPTLRARDLRCADRRKVMLPQLVDAYTRQIDREGQKLAQGSALFNISLCREVSTCLASAATDVEHIVAWLGGRHRFDRERFEADLVGASEESGE